MTAIFITATGTDVGKTLVTCGLIRHFRREGGAVAAIKPVVSGFDPAASAGSDPAALLAALGSAVTIAQLEHVSPWRFAAPLSPDMAAAREGRAIEFAAVADFCRRAVVAHRGHLLIEGIGGIMVPLDARRTMLDLMVELKLPLLLVAGSYVGTISHTLTALEVLTRRDLDVVAVAVSESARSAASLEDTVAVLARFSAVEVIAIPRLADTAASHPAFARIARAIANLKRRVAPPPF